MTYEIVARGAVELRWDASNERLPAETEERVEVLWRTAQLENPTLFDSDLLVFREWHPGGPLIGRFARYKHFLARRAGLDIPLRPVGVSGLLRRGDSILYGRRGANVAQCAGLLELAPSGSIEIGFARRDGSVDTTGQVLQELKEETGYEPDEVERVRCLGLVLDPDHQIYDVALELRLRPETEPAKASSEYATLRWGRLDEVSSMAKWRPEDWVPISLGILELCRSIDATDSSRPT